jgi:hypothetical protein
VLSFQNYTLLIANNLYYWFSVGEGTLPPHHLIAQNTPLIMYVEKKNQFTSINSGTHGKKYRYSWKEIAIAITAIMAIPPIKKES